MHTFPLGWQGDLRLAAEEAAEAMVGPGEEVQRLHEDPGHFRAVAADVTLACDDDLLSDCSAHN